MIKSSTPGEGSLLGEHAGSPEESCGKGNLLALLSPNACPTIPSWDSAQDTPQSTFPSVDCVESGIGESIAVKVLPSRPLPCTKIAWSRITWSLKCCLEGHVHIGRDLGARIPKPSLFSFKLTGGPASLGSLDILSPGSYFYQIDWVRELYP